MIQSVPCDNDAGYTCDANGTLSALPNGGRRRWGIDDNRPTNDGTWTYNYDNKGDRTEKEKIGASKSALPIFAPGSVAGTVRPYLTPRRRGVASRWEARKAIRR